MNNYSEPSAFSKYLPVSNKDRDWQIFCTCAGASVIPPGADYPVRPKEHPKEYVRYWTDDPGKGRVLQEYQILYITEGRGTFCSNAGELFRITEGTVFLLFPGVAHWYCPDIDTGWNEYWVGFNGMYPRNLQKAGFFTPGKPVYHLGLYESLVEDFLNILRAARDEKPGFQQLCGSFIISILAKVLSFSQKKERNAKADAVVEKARVLFEENLFSDLEMTDILKSLDIDYSKFRKIFKSYTGLSPYQYYLQMKINKAKQLLEEGELSVKEIAHILSFENQYYFSRIFKNKTGQSPTNWQREHTI